MELRNCIQWPKQRAWGWYATLIRTPWFCIKLLRFKPYGKLSMQRHAYRTERWFFIKGIGRVITPIGSCRSVLFTQWIVEKRAWHQFLAFNKPVYIIELQYGKKVMENDIERK